MDLEGANRGDLNQKRIPQIAGKAVYSWKDFPSPAGLDGDIMKSDYISPLDDLAFDMYQDPEVAQIIRKLDERKHEAVQKEQYDYAKNLKQAIADLQKVGERLGRYEVEKRCAVEKEDYDLAKEKKQQMELFRAQVYEQLALRSLADPDLMGQIIYQKATGQPGSVEQEACGGRRRTSGGESPSPLSSAAALPFPQLEALPYDERPLPTVRRQLAVAPEPQKSDTDASEAPKGSSGGEPEPLTEKALREASFAVEVLGETLVAGAYSKTWSYREDALLALYKHLVEMPVGTSKEDVKNTLRAATVLIRRAVRDTVTPVFQASLKLLKMIITQYIPKHKLSKLETSHCVERTIPILLTRAGDSSARLRIIASNFIQEMALFKEVKSLQIIPSYLMQPLKANSSTHLAKSQIDLLARLLRDLGTEGSGFTVGDVMEFSVSALDHRVYEVRETAVRIILDMYQQHRAFILEYLPPDDTTTRKNVLYKTIFEGFRKIDGRPTDAEIKAQKKAATEEAEKRKKEEIKALQGQLAALRETRAEAPAVKEKESEEVKSKTRETQGRKAAPPTALETPDNHFLDNLCIFCGERSESFTEEGLDLHYWKHCLMLTRCDYCKQVVEIPSLTEHLLTECDRQDQFRKCWRCSEAVLKEELSRHIKTKGCNHSGATKSHFTEIVSAAKSEKLANRCPLCHENFNPGEEEATSGGPSVAWLTLHLLLFQAWKAHLMGPGGCTMNLRKTHVLSRAPPLPPGKGPATTKSGASGAKVGSKIPTLRGALSKSTGRTHTQR
ncbi:hypothetical protein MC885_009174 [Smutsia gigantea]|nr:hypothetical protein MC885_009174 [Smutsia gigantea]